MLAAARVPRGKQRASNAVVILGGPLIERLSRSLQAVAGAGRHLRRPSLLVAAGMASLDFATAGPDDAQAALAALVGREDRAIVEGVVDVGGGRSGTAWPLVTVALPSFAGARLWLLAPGARRTPARRRSLARVDHRRRRARCSAPPASSCS